LVYFQTTLYPLEDKLTTLIKNANLATLTIYSAPVHMSRLQVRKRVSSVCCFET